MESFHTKAVGVTYPNDDGTDRQKIIAKCKVGDRLILQHEPENPYDENAIAVYCRQSSFFGGSKIKQIGHLPSRTARNLHMDERIVDGGQLDAKISAVTGGYDGKTMGVNIEIYYPSP